MFTICSKIKAFHLNLKKRIRSIQLCIHNIYYKRLQLRKTYQTLKVNI